VGEVEDSLLRPNYDLVVVPNEDSDGLLAIGEVDLLVNVEVGVGHLRRRCWLMYKKLLIK
jgi:hypothetical protein